MENCKAKGMFGTICRRHTDICMHFREFEEGDPKVTSEMMREAECPDELIVQVEQRKKEREEERQAFLDEVDKLDE